VSSNLSSVQTIYLTMSIYTFNYYC